MSLAEINYDKKERTKPLNDSQKAVLRQLVEENYQLC